MSCSYSPKRKRGDWAIPALTLGVMFASGALAANLSILPNSAELNGPEARHQLLAEASVDGHREDWTRAAAWISSNPKVATVDQTGLVTPVSDGPVTITAKAQGQSASANLRV